MTVGWSEGNEPDPVHLSLVGKLRAALRAVLIISMIVVCLVVMVLLRIPERALHERRRPWTRYIVQFVCSMSLRILGIKVVQHGTPMQEAGAVVANHTSWLDILVMNASQHVFFVSKDDVADWPGIGTLAKAAGTMFIIRDRAYADQQTAMLTKRLKAGHKMLFFPEGTSTDGMRVLRFKPTLFEAFLEPGLPDETYIQCISAVFHAPEGEDLRFYGWWGDISFGAHLLSILGQRPQGWVELTYHPPIKVWDHPDRKVLAAVCEDKVRTTHHANHQGIVVQTDVISN